MIDAGRFDQLRDEWHAITHPPRPNVDRFRALKAEADALIAAGRWASGPSDMLSVLGRSRDELMHSRLIAWLFVPTNRHGLGRRLLLQFVDALWPDEQLLRSGIVDIETEESGSAIDELGQLREARADIVVRGEGVTIVIENKLDAGEQPDQCERLYWGWAAQTGDARYVFLTPSGRAPTTTRSAAAAAAWRSMSYAKLRDILAATLNAPGARPGAGRPTAEQYLSTLMASVAPR
jgi:hypothetical protein